MITLNISSRYPLCKLANFAPRTKTIAIDDVHGITDTGATLVFVKEGVLVPNKQPATNPLTVNLPNDRQVKSTHTCDVMVPGLPRSLVGHIIPHLAIASLFWYPPIVQCKMHCSIP